MIKKALTNVFSNKLLIYQFGQGNSYQKRQKQAQLAKKIRQNLEPTYLQVIDTTIGANSCGQMYRFLVESPKFQGKTKVQQHQMVSQVLKQQLKNIHGFSLTTKIPVPRKQPLKDQTKNDTKDKGQEK